MEWVELVFKGALSAVFTGSQPAGAELHNDLVGQPGSSTSIPSAMKTLW